MHTGTTQTPTNTHSSAHRHCFENLLFAKMVSQSLVERSGASGHMLRLPAHLDVLCWFMLVQVVKLLEASYGPHVASNSWFLCVCHCHSQSYSLYVAGSLGLEEMATLCRIAETH